MNRVATPRIRRTLMRSTPVIFASVILARVILARVTLAATTFCCLVVIAFGCARHHVPDPRQAAAAFADAVERQDVDAAYRLLNAESRRMLSKPELKRLMAESKRELLRSAKGLRSEATRVDALAKVRFEDGEISTLSLEDGRFWVEAAGAIPAGARTPVEALSELRAVLARRSYPGLIQVLSSDSRVVLEERLRSLVEALEEPETLQVETAGDAATVRTPGGHRVELKREQGLWKVQDFE